MVHNEKSNDFDKPDDILHGRFELSSNDILKFVDDFFTRRNYDEIIFINIFRVNRNEEQVEQIIPLKGSDNLFYFKKSSPDVCKPLEYRGVLSTSPDNEIRICEIQIARVHANSVSPVDVNITCVWKPILAYLEELSEQIARKLPRVDVDPRIKVDGFPAPQKEVYLGHKKPGRPSDPPYDEAAKMIKGGMTEKDAFDWYCDKAKIEKPNRNDRNNFKSAMRRRGAI